MSGQWIVVDGAPLILCALVWGFLTTTIVQNLRTRGVTTATVVAATNPTLQNRVYKRAGALLLLLGAAGGFLPSLYKLATTGHVWSVNNQHPHDMVDVALLIHIPLAVIWAVLASVQLWSGQIASRRGLHQFSGWLAILTGVTGIGVVGGWAWPLMNDFADGLDSPTAGAGIYTMIMGLGIVINGAMVAYYARKKDLARHKDHSLMMIFWAMDPGIHRLYMWLMRLFCWDCWAPESTQGMGIAIAKLPANLTLIVWAILVAYVARRVNRIFLANVLGQFALWSLGMIGVMGVFWSSTAGLLVVAISAVLLTLSLWLWREKFSGSSRGSLPV